MALSYYLLKVVTCSAILFAYYMLVLKDKPFHYYNRYYLITVVLISWMLPLVKINLTGMETNMQTPVIHYAKIIADSNSQYEQAMTQYNPPFQWDLLVEWISVLISSVIFITFLHSLSKIFMLLKKFSIQTYEDIKLVNTDINGTPFSFFKYIFWHRDIDISSRTGEQMMQHELVHVREKHSIDKVFMELMMVVGWFNPIFWFLKKELYLIHEFIADHASIENKDASLLAEMLLLAAYPSNANRLSNPFFFSPIKRRITMLTKKTATRFSYLRRLMILPILSIMILLLAFRYVNKNEVRSILPLKKTYTIIVDAGHGGDDIGAKATTGELEKNLALSVVKKIKELNSNANLNIVLNRDNDVFIPVNNRHEKTINLHADLFVSVHFNAAGNKYQSKNGFEICIPDTTNKHYKQSGALASAISQHMDDLFSSSKILTRERKIWILDQTPCPAVLVQPGYITNPSDLNIMKTRRVEIAQKILSGIELYFKSTE